MTKALAETQAVAAKALALMSDQAIPATPDQYEIWFHYAAGEPPELVDRIDQMREAGQAFDRTSVRELRQLCMLEDIDLSDTIRSAGDKLSSEVDRILGMLDDVTDGASAYGDSLKGAHSALGNANSPDELKTVVKTLVLATREMEANTKNLEEKLERSKQEVSQLREDLDSVRSEAMTDALTGLPNRRAFEEALQREAIVAMQTDAPLTLLIGDVDNFKKFNDTWGHRTGDQVLRFIASVLTNTLKGRDTPARYGGEEFAVILPRTKIENAGHVAESLLRNVSAKDLKRKTTGEMIGRITLSFGVAEYRPGEPLPSLVERADACLYAAKTAGRNRVKTELEVPQDAVAKRA